MAEATATDWEYRTGEGRSARPDAPPVLSVAGFDGPLDFLLEMARRHRIDLGELALLPLIDQFVAALEAARARVPLERRGDWLVMASTLLQLRAQLLWPATPQAAAAAQADAARRLAALDELARMRAAAVWLAARPRLGIDVFARGQHDRTPAPQADLYVAFLEATLAMLEGRAGQGTETDSACRPPLSDLWRPGDAIARLRQKLAESAETRPLGAFLPTIPAEADARELRCRAVLASTFLAGLELARDGTLAAEQIEPFGVILLHPTPAAPSGTAARPA